MAETFLIVVFVIPIFWSALVASLKWALARLEVPNDRFEKAMLLILCGPVVMGLSWIAMQILIPLQVSIPVIRDLGPVQVLPLQPHGLVTHASPIGWQLLSPCLVGLYTLVFGLKAVRLLIVQFRLARLKRRAIETDISGDRVWITDAFVPPLALGRHTVILPQRLVSQMPNSQVNLIIRHEQAHLRRRDPAYFALLSWLEALLWFNPFLYAQAARCRLAAELDCDAAVVAQSPGEQSTYAKTLILALKYAAAGVEHYAPAASSFNMSGDYSMRLRHIMRTDTASRKSHLGLYTAVALALVPLLAAQFAWSQGAPDKPKLSVAPVAGQIASGFGMRKDPLTGKMTFHRGVDFNIPEGTPVHAPGDGKVSAVYDNPKYGKVVEIDHGDGITTLLAHLAKSEVVWGQVVTAGQEVATSGNTGSSVGPHLHFEVHLHGKVQDPVKFDKAFVPQTADTSGRVLADKVHSSPQGVIEAWGHVAFQQKGETLHADYLRWDTHTGALNLKGHIETSTAQGERKPGAAWTPVKSTG